MTVQALATNVDATAVAAAASVDLENKTPFLPGRKVKARIGFSADVAGAPVVKIQGSDDDSAWTDLLTSTGLIEKEGMVTAYRYMRSNVTTGATTTGTYSATVEAGP